MLKFGIKSPKKMVSLIGFPRILYRFEFTIQYLRSLSVALTNAKQCWNIWKLFEETAADRLRCYFTENWNTPLLTNRCYSMFRQTGHSIWWHWRRLHSIWFVIFPSTPWADACGGQFFAWENGSSRIADIPCSADRRLIDFASILLCLQWWFYRARGM